MIEMDRFKLYFYDLNRMTIINEHGVSIENWMIEHGYMRIAIYGMGDLGQRLKNVLSEGKVNICYTIDKNKGNVKGDNVKDFDDQWEPVDLIIVTLCDLYEVIRVDISEKCNYKIMSLEELLYSIPVEGVDFYK